MFKLELDANTERQILENFSWQLDSIRKHVATMRRDIAVAVAAEDSDLSYLSKWNADNMIKQGNLLKAYERVNAELIKHPTADVMVQIMSEVVRNAAYGETNVETTTEHWALAKVLTDNFQTKKMFLSHWTGRD